MGTPALGVASKVGWSQTLSGTGVTRQYDVLSESVAWRNSHISGAGIRGTRSHPKERLRHGTYTVGGNVTLNPSHLDLDHILPLILGAAESTDTFALAETVPDFYFQKDLVTKVPTYAGCKVARAVFSGSEGGLLTLALDLEGKTEGSVSGGTFTAGHSADGTPAIGAASSFPSLTLGTSVNDQPFAFSDLVLECFSVVGVEVKSFEITIDNGLDFRFSASRSRTAIMATDRTITVRATVPYTTTEAAMFDVALGGAACVFSFANAAGNVLTFSFAALQAAGETPIIQGKTETLLEINGVARKSGSTAELIVSNALSG